MIKANISRSSKGLDTFYRYTGANESFLDFWQTSRLQDQMLVFWFPDSNGNPEPFRGRIIGVTNVHNDVLLHLQTSDDSITFLLLSQALGLTGFEIRPEKEEEEE